MDSKKTRNENNFFIILLVVLMVVAVAVAIAGSIAKNNSAPVMKEDPFPETSAPEKKDSALREDRVHDAEEEVTLSKSETSAAEDTENVIETDKGSEKVTEEDAIKEEPLPEFTLPVSGEVLKAHSTDVPVFSITMEDYRTHDGVDIFAKEGTEVCCAADGKVEEIWEDPMMGECISISHGGGAVTTYKNLSDGFPDGIEKGAVVKSGQVIGSVGDTALEEVAEESHLHFEIAVNGESADPKDYLIFPAQADFSE